MSNEASLEQKFNSDGTHVVEGSRSPLDVFKSLIAWLVFTAVVVSIVMFQFQLQRDAGAHAVNALQRTQLPVADFTFYIKRESSESVTVHVFFQPKGRDTRLFSELKAPYQYWVGHFVYPSLSTSDASLVGRWLKVDVEALILGSTTRGIFSVVDGSNQEYREQGIPQLDVIATNTYFDMLGPLTIWNLICFGTVTTMFLLGTANRNPFPSLILNSMLLLIFLVPPYLSYYQPSEPHIDWMKQAIEAYESPTTTLILHESLQKHN